MPSELLSYQRSYITISFFSQLKYYKNIEKKKEKRKKQNKTKTKNNKERQRIIEQKEKELSTFLSGKEKAENSTQPL